MELVFISVWLKVFQVAVKRTMLHPPHTLCARKLLGQHYTCRDPMHSYHLHHPQFLLHTPITTPFTTPLHCLPHHPQSQTQLSHMGSGYETVPSTQYMCHSFSLNIILCKERGTVQAKTVYESIGRWGNDDDNTVFFYVFSCSSSDWPSSNREEPPPPPHDCSCPPSHCLVFCSDPPCSPVHSSPS